MFKFELDQQVWYLYNNTVCSAPVLARKCVDNKFADIARNIPYDLSKWTDQQKFFCHFGRTQTKYATCHGVFDEKVMHPSKQALIDSLILSPDNVKYVTPQST